MIKCYSQNKTLLFTGLKFLWLGLCLDLVRRGISLELEEKSFHVVFLLRSSTVGWQSGIVDFWLCIWFSDNFSFSFPVWLYIHLVTELKLVKTETFSSKIRKRSYFKTR